MAAGLGFKDFSTGEVLTAADVDGYLMQNIWVFASTAARDAAVTSPQEGNFAFTKDTNSLWYYDGAAWVASGATGDIEGVTAGIGISGGGTSGTVTVTNSMATAIDAKGDLVAGTGADTFAKLTVGANDTVLTADSAQATGLKWATPSAAGDNFTLLNSGGTALSGATTTISGISGKGKIYIIIENCSSASAGGTVDLRVNGDTGNNYFTVGPKVNQAASYAATNLTQSTSTAAGKIGFGQLSSNSASVLAAFAFIDGANSSGVKPIIYGGSATAAGGSAQAANWGGGMWTGSATVSSISILSESGNFDSGTVYVYTSA